MIYTVSALQLINEVNDLCIIVQWVLRWRSVIYEGIQMGYYSLFSCRYNETDVVIFLKQEAMQDSGAGVYMASKAKRRKWKIGLPNSTEISSPTRLCVGSNWVSVWTCASLREKKWVQFIRVVILLWIRPSIRYQATVPARSIISAGPWDGCSNAVINGFVRPSNLSADTEGLNNHERNEDRRRLFPHRQKSQLKLRNFWMGVKCQKWCG